MYLRHVILFSVALNVGVSPEITSLMGSTLVGSQPVPVGHNEKPTHDTGAAVSSVGCRSWQKKLCDSHKASGAGPKAHAGPR